MKVLWIWTKFFFQFFVLSIKARVCVILTLILLSKGTREFWACLSEPHNSYNRRLSDFLHQNRENEVSWSKEIYDIYWQLFTAIWGIWSFYLGKGIANVFGWFSFVKKCLMILGVFAIILNLGWIRCKPFFTKNWKSWLIFVCRWSRFCSCFSVCLFVCFLWFIFQMLKNFPSFFSHRCTCIVVFFKRDKK